ncbi:MAG: hypothetical protein HON14_16555 [Rhodospirillaceae bacterium]|jgi:hypothetical protein|nr:hypothetical protein [Rhodospirillaceae bacterium]MBT4940750.1 hypothetical protein [Rhodospirillaceae bacterium]MBT5938999.1 hypothetical protein [Rhodospirillaceae bacterium]MBT7266718.1 hypothetical protein [Rhodospirillaceae bacterium]
MHLQSNHIIAMAYQYSIHPDINCVYVEHTGTFEVDEEQHQLIEMEANPHFTRGMDILRDISATSFPEIYNFEYFKHQSHSQFKDIASGLGRCKIAWVLGNGRDYGLVRQWVTTLNLTSATIERKPFRDIDAAKDWLNVPKDYSFS